LSENGGSLEKSIRISLTSWKLSKEKERKKALIILVSKDELQKIPQNVYAMGGMLKSIKGSLPPVLIKYC
jgi:hypothetical protein